MTLQILNYFTQKLFVKIKSIGIISIFTEAREQLDNQMLSFSCKKFDFDKH